MLTLSAVEKVCAARGMTLVMHPAVRRAVQHYEESFYVGTCCFLRGETDGLFFLPLRSGGYIRLLFSRRSSPKGYPILRVDPVASDGLHRIKAALEDGTL